jgi:hypothetical protein
LEDEEMKSVTKDSGQHKEFDTGFRRDINEGKPRFDLCMPTIIPYSSQMLTRFAELMERGRIKYAARNWEQAKTQEELDRFKEGFMRHAMQWMAGETDEDHAAACYFNIMGAEYIRWRLENGK